MNMVLPTELYARIFEQMSLYDRIQMSNVSNCFNELNDRVEYTRQISTSEIVEFPKYIVNIEFTNFYNGPDVKILNKLIQIKKFNIDYIDSNTIQICNLLYLESLKIESFYFDDKHHQKFVEDIKSLKYFKKLMISFSENRETKIIDFCNHLTHLKSLKIGIDDQNITEELLINLSRVENIKELRLTDCYIDKYDTLLHLNKFKNLKSLYLIDVYVSDYNNFKFLENLRLKKLDINISVNQTDLIYLEKLKELKSLSINIDRNTKIEVLLFLNKLNNLRKIKINISQELNFDTIKYLNEVKKLHICIYNDVSLERIKCLTELNNLKSLSISRYSITVSDLKELKQFRYLKKLSVSSFESIIDIKLIEVIRSMNLKKLIISDSDEKKENIKTMRRSLSQTLVKFY